jgi:hypothetical protein
MEITGEERRKRENRTLEKETGLQDYSPEKF